MISKNYFFEVEGISINNKVYFYSSDDLNEINDMGDGDICFCKNKIYMYKGEKWEELISKNEIKKMIVRYG